MAGAAAASKYVMQDGKAIYRADDSPDVIEFNNCLVSMVGVLRSGTRTKLIPKIKEAESLQKALFSRLEADDRRLREELMRITDVALVHGEDCAGEEEIDIITDFHFSLGKATEAIAKYVKEHEDEVEGWLDACPDANHRYNFYRTLKSKGDKDPGLATFKKDSIAEFGSPERKRLTRKEFIAWYIGLWAPILVPEQFRW